MNLLSLDYRNEPIITAELSKKERVRAKLAPQVYFNIRKVLEQHNELSDKHVELIKVMSLGLSNQAAGLTTARYVYYSDCGLVKTTTLISLIQAIHQLDLPISLLIASAQIEPNCQIVRELIESGVPESKLGILHSDPSASHPSINPAQRQKTQFLFVCHARFNYSRDIVKSGVQRQN